MNCYYISPFPLVSVHKQGREDKQHVGRDVQFGVQRSTREVPPSCAAQQLYAVVNSGDSSYVRACRGTWMGPPKSQTPNAGFFFRHILTWRFSSGMSRSRQDAVKFARKFTNHLKSPNERRVDTEGQTLRAAYDYQKCGARKKTTVTSLSGGLIWDSRIICILLLSTRSGSPKFYSAFLSRTRHVLSTNPTHSLGILNH